MAGLHPKVTAGVVAGAVTSLVVAELARRGIPIGADEASSLTVLLSFAAGYFVPANGADDSAPAPETQEDYLRGIAGARWQSPPLPPAAPTVTPAGGSP